MSENNPTHGISRFLTEKEEHLVKLVWILSYGTNLTYGLTHKEVRDWLINPNARLDYKSAIEMLDTNPSEFFTKLEKYLEI